MSTFDSVHSPASPAREALAGEVPVAMRGAATTGAEQNCEGRRGQ